jgi:hypothetical protein
MKCYTSDWDNAICPSTTTAWLTIAPPFMNALATNEKIVCQVGEACPIDTPHHVQTQLIINESRVDYSE